MNQRICLIALLLGAAAWLPARADSNSFRGKVMQGGHPSEDTVVWLDAPNVPRSAERKHPVLDQRNMTFYPHVLAVQVGSVVDFPNHDRVFHNVFSFHDGKRFDLGLYPVGAVRQVRFDRPGLSRIFCNIHPHMAAYVYALDTPIFAVSDSRGAFSLHDVPPGKYRYHAWRPGTDPIEGTVNLTTGQSWELKWP